MKVTQNQHKEDVMKEKEIPTFLAACLMQKLPDNLKTISSIEIILNETLNLFKSMSLDMSEWQK